MLTGGDRAALDRECNTYANFAIALGKPHALLRITCASLLLLEACAGKVIDADNNHDAGTTTSKCATIAERPSTQHYVLAVSYLGHTFAVIVFDAMLDSDSREMCMILQPLAAADRTMPVGTPVTGGPFVLGDSDLYLAHYAMLIPKEADGIWTSTREMQADFQLEALESTCGVVIGCLTPHDSICHNLTGSTFALTPTTDPDAHAQPIIDCAGTRADPL